MRLFQEHDGASPSARAVLARLSGHPGIEGSWNRQYHIYDATPHVARWHNGREQGYVVTLRSNDYSRQLNIAFFEHRNSDNVCAVEWEQVTMNPPTIDTADFPPGVYATKYDVTASFTPEKIWQAADWVYTRLCEWWAETSITRGDEA